MRDSSEILDGKMGNEPHFYLCHFWKGGQLAVQKQTYKQARSPSYFYLDFGESTSQVCPKY